MKIFKYWGRLLLIAYFMYFGLTEWHTYNELEKGFVIIIIFVICYWIYHSMEEDDHLEFMKKLRDDADKKDNDDA